MLRDADGAAIASFLRAHPPFDALSEEALERIAAAIHVEQSGAGATIFRQGAEPVEHLRMIRAGAVEIMHDGSVLDLLVEGELFGHASMLSGLPTGFEARAAENTICYRIPAATARELLGEPAGLRFLARSLIDEPDPHAAAITAARDPSHQPVGTLLHGDPVVCDPAISVREAAELMEAAGATSVVVELPEASFGIVTDHDLRTRVIAAGLGGDVPLSAVMSAPAYTCSPDRLGRELLLEMLDRGFRHVPVVSATGKILGVVEDRDLVAALTRSSFYLRARMERAQTEEELRSAASELPAMVIALHDARVAAVNAMAVYAVVVDALTRRLLELAAAETGPPPAPFAWLALGSLGRREPVPSSDVDSAIVYFSASDDAGTRAALHELGKRVSAGLDACGLPADRNGATAASATFVRSVDSWQHATRTLIADPTQEKAVLLVSVIADSRPVWGVHTGTPVADTLRLAPDSPALLKLLARFALSYRPPTGFFRGLVVEHGGEHRGTLDLKHGGVIPIADLARWAGMAAGVTSASTVERLRAAGDAGTLPAGDARTLEEAFELVSGLRLAHQVEQLRAGLAPDDHIDPSALSQLTRSHLREAFRAVAQVQRRIASELRMVKVDAI